MDTRSLKGIRCQFPPNQGFSTVTLLTFGAGPFFGVGVCPVLCKTFSGISDLSLPDDSGIPSPQVVTTKNICRETKLPLVESYRSCYK